MKTYAISETLPNAAKPMVAEAGTMSRREKQQEHQLPILSAYHATPRRIIMDRLKIMTDN